MNDLREQAFKAFATGTAEEPAATLARIAAVLTHPKTGRADHNFPHQAGSTKDDDDNKTTTPQ
jgi:hypothetical protein